MKGIPAIVLGLTLAGVWHTVVIDGGGIEQQPSPWGSRDNPTATLFINERPVPLTAADGRTNNASSTVFFTRQAMDFIRKCAAKGEPFPAYVPFNIAHSPHNLPPDAWLGLTPFVGAVENLVANVGRLQPRHPQPSTP